MERKRLAALAPEYLIQVVWKKVFKDGNGGSAEDDFINMLKL